MVCCLCLHLNRCCLEKIVWYSHMNNFTAGPKCIILCDEFEKYNSKINATSFRGQWVKVCLTTYKRNTQATGLDAWASRVKCPARFVSHLHEICIYIWVVYSLCFFCCLFITVTWWYVWCFEWASGNQEEVQACLVTLWLSIISCYSLYKTTLGLLCSWFENNPHFHKYSIDFHV